MIIQKFLEFLAQEKRYSPHTVESYRKDLQDFKLFLAETEGLENLEKADRRMVRNFMIDLSEKGLAKRSVNRKISSFRSFYNFLLKIGEISATPLETVSSLKFYAEKQVPFSEEEMEDLQKSFQENPLSVESVIIETLYQTGMRKAELCSVKLEDIDFTKREINVFGKGNKMRKVPVSEKFIEVLKSYSATRNPKSSDEEFFFLTNSGKKIYPKFVYNVVKSYFSTVSLKEKRSPHILRHTFATHLLNNGAEISKVKSLLGHASLASTQVYTSANIEQLKNAFNNAHPRAKKEKDNV